MWNAQVVGIPISSIISRPDTSISKFTTTRQEMTIIGLCSRLVTKLQYITILVQYLEQDFLDRLSLLVSLGVNDDFNRNQEMGNPDTKACQEPPRPDTNINMRVPIICIECVWSSVYLSRVPFSQRIEATPRASHPCVGRCFKI